MSAEIATNTPPPAANTIVAREPNAVLSIVRWVDDKPRKTGMKTSDLRAKFQRDGVVLDKDGNELTVPVVGSERQFEAASDSQIEAYYGEKSQAWYFQPALTDAKVAGPKNLFG